MNNQKKESYIVSAIFVLIGLVIIYSTWRNFDLSFWVGTFLTGLGIASFKWPNVAEVLLHWVKSQQPRSKNTQIQKNSKNSNQVITNSGNVQIHQHFNYNKRHRKKRY